MWLMSLMGAVLRQRREEPGTNCQLLDLVATTRLITGSLRPAERMLVC